MLLCPLINTTVFMLSRVEWGYANLFAPPASGLTITQSFTFKFSRIHLNVLGSAYRLSTGTLKNPWIWLACKSIVMT